MTATALGTAPTLTVETTAPVVVSSTDTVLSVWLPTYARDPSGLTATGSGLLPTAVESTSGCWAGVGVPGVITRSAPSLVSVTHTRPSAPTATKWSPFSTNKSVSGSVPMVNPLRRLASNTVTVSLPLAT